MKFESWRIFRLAKQELPPGVIQKLYTRSSRLVDLWAANPRYCEATARNPLDRIRILLKELALAGYEDYVVGTLDWLAEVVGRRTALVGRVASDKGTVDGEIGDLAVAMGLLVNEVRQAVTDNRLDGGELLRIKNSALRVSNEVDQLLDAAGVTKDDER